MFSSKTFSSRTFGKVVLAVALAVAACGGSPEARRPGVDLSIYDTAVKALITKESSQRTIGDFDVTRDLKIDATDLITIDTLMVRARNFATSRHIDLSAKAALYEGGTFELDDELRMPANADDASVRALTIEAQWLSDQARFAAVIDWDPNALVAGALARHIPGYDSEAMTPAALCEAIDTIDLESFRRAALPAVAVTDLDFTLWQGDISNVFLAVLAERRLVLPGANPALIEVLSRTAGVDVQRVRQAPVHENMKLAYERATNTSLPKEQRIGIKDAFFLTSKVLAGLDVGTVNEAAHLAMGIGAVGVPAIMTRFRNDASGCGALALLEKLSARGIDVYFLSATLDVLARAAARAVGIPEDHAIGSSLEIVNGRYTGEVITSTYDIKGPVLRQWVKVPPLMVFGDSPTSDLPMMLEAVGTGFMVNPRPEIIEKDREIAQGRLVSLTFTPGEQRADAR